MSQYITIILLAFIAILTGCQKRPGTFNPEDGMAAFSSDSLRQVISVLAADSMEGRKPLTVGETRTISYLQKKFSESGMEPGSGSSFLQEVPMVNITAIADPTMKVVSSKGEFTLNAYDDYIIWTNKTDEKINIDDAEVIFVGYGVVAPEYGWNDYEGLDVKGKIVMVMVNDPGFWVGDTTLFKGRTMTYYGRWTYKFEEAARQGAKGCLIIHNTEAASYPFAVPQNNFNTARLLLDNRNKDIPNCDMVGWVTETSGKKLLIAAGEDSTLLMAANKPGFKAVPLGLKLSTSLKVQASYGTSYNVAGKITGTKYPDEVIIYTGHWDHLGIGKPDETGDTIYNGALDNATAVGGLLELARAFKNMEVQPERTIMFLAVTAEEQGLLGSAYFVENPLFPLDKIVANINMECLNTGTRTNDMVIIGAGNTDLEEMLAEEISKEGGYLSPETMPEAGSFFRSDHFPFVKAGVPALYMVTGTDVVGKGKEYGMMLEEDYRKNHYHRPSDEYNENTWTMEGAMFELRLFFRVGNRLAFGENRPQWNSNSEYK